MTLMHCDCREGFGLRFLLRRENHDNELLSDDCIELHDRQNNPSHLEYTVRPFILKNTSSVILSASESVTLHTRYSLQNIENWSHQTIGALH